MLHDGYECTGKGVEVDLQAHIEVHRLRFTVEQVIRSPYTLPLLVQYAINYPIKSYTIFSPVTFNTKLPAPGLLTTTAS
jgi:hypothetical protein